jgi:hypothetical protein
VHFQDIELQESDQWLVKENALKKLGAGIEGFCRDMGVEVVLA